MKATLLIISLILAVNTVVGAEETEAGLRECLDVANVGTIGGLTESESELHEQGYASAVVSCLQDHLTTYASSGEFSDPEDGLDPAERRFSHINASRRSIGSRSSSIHEPGFRNSRHVGRSPTRRHRSIHRSGRVVIPR